MNRRDVLRTLLASPGLFAASGCSYLASPARTKQVMTVSGFLDAAEIGMTLTHEHLFADLRSYDEQTNRHLDIDIDEVIEVALPYLNQIRELGCRTLVDCTATHLGRHPALLKRLAAASGLHMLTVTGAYLAADERFVPEYVRRESSDRLARRWIDEWRYGIGDTGVRPGLIKLGLNGGTLTTLEETVFRAAVKTHQETGLTIATHIGPWREAEPGLNGAAVAHVLRILDEAQVSPSAWIWYHAQSEKDASYHVRAAERGAWVAFDGVGPEALEHYVVLVRTMKERGLLHQVLVSHDAGWYTAGEPRGGTFRSFDTVFTRFIPALRASAFSEGEITQLFVRNPAEALAVRTRHARPDRVAADRASADV